MKHFYKVLQGTQNAASMVALMQKQEAFRPSPVEGVFSFIARDKDGDTIMGQEFPLLKSDARGLMIAVNGSLLGQIIVVRLEAKARAPLPPDPLFIQALHVERNAQLSADEEAVNVQNGDVWMLAGHPKDAFLVNHSDNDIIAALIEIGF